MSLERSGSDSKISLCDDGRLASLKAKKATNRRFEAAAWVKSMVGSLDIPCEPPISEEEFRLRLRNGIILCNLLNKVQPGAVSKVVANHVSSHPPEGRSLSAYQSFENVQNFLVAVQKMKLPTFEFSHLEQPGSTAKIVDCILALKAYYERKQRGGNGSSKYVDPLRIPMAPRNTVSFLQHTTPCVPVKAPETLPNPSIRNMDEGEKRLDDLIGDWPKHVVEEITSDKENVDQNLVEAIQAAAPHGSTQTVINLIIEIIADNKDLKGNKILYNNLQELKGRCIRIYCRIRTHFGGQCDAQSTVEFIGKDASLLVNITSKMGKDVQRIFNFNKVFAPSATQEDIYMDTQPLIRSVMEGYNVCVFAYGQIGSGKTHTMSGPTGTSERDMGVNYQVLSDLFELSQKRKDLMMYDVSVQMIEIYNEQVRDLLGTYASNNKLDIRNNGHNGFNVHDAILMPVKATSDVLDLMNLGRKNRAVSYTPLNDHSSCSHRALTVHVQGTDRVSGDNLHSCLNLVDLAGSESVDKSEATGNRLKEAQYINKSLSSLGDVLAALAQRSPHVPYRNSKLTQLLQVSLGGKAKTLMFVHISPEPDSYAGTTSTLKFAELDSMGVARLNSESGEVRELKEHVDSFKKALEIKKETEVAQLQNMKASPYKLHTPVRTRRLSLEGTVNNCSWNGNCKCGMVSQNDKLVDSGEKSKLNNNEFHTLVRTRRSSLEGTVITVIGMVMVSAVGWFLKRIKW